MIEVKRIRLFNWKLFKRVDLLFGGPRVQIVGPNGSGKSSLVEAIYFSFRFSPLKRGLRGYLNLIRKGAGSASGEVNFSFLSIPHVVRFYVEKGGASFWFDRDPVLNKREFLLRYPIVSFVPEDILYVSGYPSYRRKFLDFMISMGEGGIPRIYREYRKELKQGVLSRDTAAKIQALREEACETLNMYVSEHGVKVVFKRGSAPSNDDFVVYRNGNHLREMGSRGEKKYIAVLLKIAVAKFIKTLRGTPPLLLLDDPFSELDGDSVSSLMNLLFDFPSFIFTSIDPIEGVDTSIVRMGRGSQNL